MLRKGIPDQLSIMMVCECTGEVASRGSIIRWTACPHFGIRGEEAEIIIITGGSSLDAFGQRQPPGSSSSSAHISLIHVASVARCEVERPGDR